MLVRAFAQKRSPVTEANKRALYADRVAPLVQYRLRTSSSAVVARRFPFSAFDGKSY